MRKAKRLTFFTAVLFLVSLTFGQLHSYAAFTPKFALHSEAVYMVNLDTDIVVVSKNIDKKMYPASTTKIMTCLLSLAYIKDFDAYVEVPYECFNEFNEDNPNYQGPSSAGIDPLQSNLTYKDALYSMMLCSGCESANILAYNVGGGSIQHFIDMMNSAAKKIGCKNTHFSNAHGLFDEENYTTAEDLYRITKYAIDRYPGFMKICGTYSYDMPANGSNPDGYTVFQTNGLMKPTGDYYYEGATGVKTGSIDKYFYKTNGTWSEENSEPGSRALVTTAQRGGYTYMIVSMGAPFFNDDGTTTVNYSFQDHINLYDWAFDEFEYTLVIGKNEQIMKVDVDKGKDVDEVGIVATEDYYTLLPKTLDLTTIQQIRPAVEMLEAPVEKGIPVGRLELKLNGETLAKLNLVTEDAVELDMAAFYTDKLKNIMSAPEFIAIVVVLVLLMIMYVCARVIRKNFNRKQAEMQRRRKIQMSPKPGSGRGYDRNGRNRPKR